MTPFALLIAAVLGLCLGPVLFVLLHSRPRPQLALDGFVLVAVVGLVVLHVLPDAYEVAGIWALVVATVGLLLPLFAERIKALSHRASHGLVLAIALLGLMLHASLDGVGVAGSEGLGIAVAVHRIPVGLAVWWLVRPQFGRRWAFAVLAGLCLATIGGFVLQNAVIDMGSVLWVQLVQALVAGSLLHVLLHQSVGFHDHTEENARWHVPGTIGALAGAMLVAGLPDPHGHSFGERIVEMTMVVAPYFIVALAIIAVGLRKHLLRLVDTVAPWSLGAVVLAATMVDMHTDFSVIGAVSAALFGAVVLLGLVHRGPREFLLEVLPLDVLQGTHKHEHDDTPPQAELSHP